MEHLYAQDREKGDGDNPNEKILQIKPINQIYIPLHCGRWAH